jgi:hypothetical protein
MPATPRAVPTGPSRPTATAPGVTTVPVPGGVAVRVSKTVLFDGTARGSGPNDTEDNRSRNRRVEIIYAAT